MRKRIYETNRIRNKEEWREGIKKAIQKTLNLTHIKQLSKDRNKLRNRMESNVKYTKSILTIHGKYKN